MFSSSPFILRDGKPFFDRSDRLGFKFDQALLTVQCIDLLHFISSEGKIKNIRIFRDLGCVSGGKHDDVSGLQLPAQNDLGGCFLVPGGGNADPA